LSLHFSTQVSAWAARAARKQNHRALHFHRYRAEPKMATIAGKAAMADPRHSAPVLHRRVGALDAGPNARGRLVEPCPPVRQRFVALGLASDPVLDPDLGEFCARRP
jgi:hypothetical protein